MRYVDISAGKDKMFVVLFFVCLEEDLFFKRFSSEKDCVLTRLTTV